MVLGGIALAEAGVVATQSPLLDVDGVRVAGAARTDPGEVLRRARIEPGDTMVGVDTGQAAARIEDLPWVERATITRQSPGTIEIEVTEREPLALAEIADGRTAVVDREGRVLEVTTTPPPDLPLLAGVRASTAVGEELGRGARDALVLLRALSERLPGTVASVSSDLDAALAAGGEVRFGSIEDLDDKIVAMETVLAAVDTTCLELLDVRVPGSPALTRNQRCS